MLLSRSLLYLLICLPQQQIVSTTMAICQVMSIQMQGRTGLFLVMAQVISDGAQADEFGGGAVLGQVGDSGPRSALRPRGVLRAACGGLSRRRWQPPLTSTG
jgi:hypothetical protein